MNNRESLKEVYLRDLKEKLEKENYNKDIIDEIAEKTAAKMMRSPEVGRNYNKGESFKESYERIDYDNLMENAKEAVDNAELVIPEEEE